MAQAVISLVSIDGLTVSLDASGSTGTITGYSWAYSGGEGGDTGVTAEHTFGAPGGYVIELTVTDADTSTSVASIAVILEDVGSIVAVTTDSITPSGQTFTVVGTVAPDSAPGEYWVEYSADPTLAGYAATAPVAFVAGLANVDVSVLITDVQPEQTVYARVAAVATGGVGGPVGRGAILSASIPPLTSSRQEQALDYVVAQIKEAVDHTRVYDNRQLIRDRSTLEQLVVGETTGLHFWECFIETSTDEWVGTQSIDVHTTITCVLRRAIRESLGTEQLTREEAREAAQALRWDFNLDGLVDSVQVQSVPVDAGEYAGVVVHVATMRLLVMEHLRRQ